jgi:hypothetical protein
VAALPARAAGVLSAAELLPTGELVVVGQFTAIGRATASLLVGTAPLGRQSVSA